VIRRIRPQQPRLASGGAPHIDRSCRRPAQHHQHPGAITIQTETLGAGQGHKRGLADVQQGAHTRHIRLDPIAQARIGQVDQRRQAPARRDRSDFPPSLQRQVSPRRIVAAAVQEDDIARPRLGQGHVQRFDVRMSVVVQVREGLRLQAHGLDQRQVRRPGRDADPDARLRIGQSDYLQRQPQGAGTARRLDAPQPSGRSAFQPWEGRLLKAQGELAIARRADIALGRLYVQDGLFGGLNRRHDGDAAALVAIGADAQINLVWSRVRLHQHTQFHQGIGAGGRQAIKHGRCPWSPLGPGRCGG